MTNTVTNKPVKIDPAPGLNCADSRPEASTVHAGRPLVSMNNPDKPDAEMVQVVSVGFAKYPVPVTVTTVAAALGGPMIAGNPVAGLKITWALTVNGALADSHTHPARASVTVSV